MMPVAASSSIVSTTWAVRKLSSAMKVLSPNIMTVKEIDEELDRRRDQGKLRTGGFWLREFIEKVRKQERRNRLFASELNQHAFKSVRDLGELKSPDFRQCYVELQAEEPEEDEFYNACKNYVLKKHKEVLLEYEEVTALLEAALQQEKEKEEAERARREDSAEHGRSAVTSNAGPDWLRVDAKHSEVRAGFVYILTNALMPDVVKVGFTAQSPPLRARRVTAELGLPVPFQVAWYVRVDDPYILEQLVQNDLAEYALGRELFRLPLEPAIKAIEKRLPPGAAPQRVGGGTA